MPLLIDGFNLIYQFPELEDLMLTGVVNRTDDHKTTGYRWSLTERTASYINIGGLFPKD